MASYTDEETPLLRANSIDGIRGSTVSFHQVSYTVQVSQPGRPPCSKVGKEILHGVNGIFKPGMNAIMGATGSGKTSLLDILAGRKNPNGLDGTVLIDGRPQPPNFKCISGYVSQDDYVMGTLTVRENLMFSASLRLKRSVNKAEKRRRVEEMLVELGLTGCADSKIGNEFIRGVSGGERKRTNIGMELIISPSVLYLDEPTTGLDASTANAVMLLLHKLGRKGRTIIFSIHQPRYSIYKLFDRLALLSMGNVVYHGPNEDALHYFSGIGYECEPHNNPPDFFLDVINGDSTAVKVTRSGNDGNHGDTAVNTSGHYEKNSEEFGNLALELKDKFAQSKWHKSLKDELAPIYSDFHRQSDDHSTAIKTPSIGYASGFFTQLGVVSFRAIRNLVRNPQATVLQFVIAIIFAIIVGTIFYQVSDNPIFAIQNRTGAIFFLIMNQAFSNMSSIELFIKERKIFMHESSNGFYRVSVYFLSKIFCDIIPVRLIPVAVFSAIAYWMIGFQSDFTRFLVFMLTLYLVAITAASIGFFFSSLVSVTAIANVLTAMFNVVMVIFGGFFVNLDSVLSWLQWIKYLSFFRYGLNALSINEMKDQVYCGSVNATIDATKCAYGNAYLAQQGVPFETDWDLWVNHVALASMGVILMVFSYLRLRFINKYT